MRFSSILRYPCMKMDDAIDAFVQYISAERRLSKLTVDEYSSVLRHFATFLKDHYSVDDVEAISHLEIRDWQLSLSEQGGKASSIKTRLVVLRTFFKFLRREGCLKKDIMLKVATPKTPKHLPVFYRENEVSHIYDDSNFDDTFEGRRDQLLLRMLYETGIRRAEVVGLTESSVDFYTNCLKVLGKRDKERIIPIENELSHTIKCYFSLKEQQVGRTESFFVRANGKPFTEYDVRKVVKRYMTLFSNADRISPHVFRHSFATHLLNEGADISAIKELLGHTDLAATEIYTHVSRQHMKEIYKHTHPREKQKNRKNN